LSDVVLEVIAFEIRMEMCKYELGKRPLSTLDC
jgi:hypothetical protein